MFNLEKEVDRWCRSVHPVGFNRNGRIAELKDHLYCTIERYQEEDGLTEAEAFAAAVGRIGTTEDLAAEHAKNRGKLFSLLCQINEFESKYIDQWSDSMSPKRIAFFTVMLSLTFAAAILLAAYFIENPEYNQTVMYILIAIWFIPFTFLTVLGVRKDEKKAS